MHISLLNGTQVVYLFNHGDEIHNITVQHTQLNSSDPVQIAIMRSDVNTTLHVNDRNKTIEIGTLLLETYSNKPWVNPEKEILAPQRPPAPPTEYFQLNLGGYDLQTLLKVSEYPAVLPGYVGCMRGLQIGDTLINLTSLVSEGGHGNFLFCLFCMLDFLMSCLRLL